MLKYLLRCIFSPEIYVLNTSIFKCIQWLQTTQTVNLRYLIPYLPCFWQNSMQKKTNRQKFIIKKKHTLFQIIFEKNRIFLKSTCLHISCQRSFFPFHTVIFYEVFLNIQFWTTFLSCLLLFWTLSVLGISQLLSS